MADLRTRFIEDYAGGLLNVSRQELTSTGEVLSQDGLLSDASLFIEDGTGTKSGLKLGIAIAEAVDPTTEEGVVNVRYADRTYASIRDLKIFSTAIASAQAALSDAATSSISNLENAFLLLEESQKTGEAGVETKLSIFEENLDDLKTIVGSSTGEQTLDKRVESLEASSAQDTSDLVSLNKIIREISLVNKVNFSGTAAVDTVKLSTEISEEDKADGSYTVSSLNSSTSGGTGLDATIIVAGNKAVSATVTDGGSGFKLGDKIIVPGTKSGGGGNIVMEVSRLNIDQTTLGTSGDTRDITLGNEIQEIIVKINTLIDILSLRV